MMASSVELVFGLLVCCVSVKSCKLLTAIGEVHYSPLCVYSDFDLEWHYYHRSSADISGGTS